MRSRALSGSQVDTDEPQSSVFYAGVLHSYFTLPWCPLGRVAPASEHDNRSRSPGRASERGISWSSFWCFLLRLKRPVPVHGTFGQRRTRWGWPDSTGWLLRSFLNTCPRSWEGRARTHGAISNRATPMKVNIDERNWNWIGLCTAYNRMQCWCINYGIQGDMFPAHSISIGGHSFIHFCFAVSPLKCQSSQSWQWFFRKLLAYFPAKIPWHFLSVLPLLAKASMDCKEINCRSHEASLHAVASRNGQGCSSSVSRHLPRSFKVNFCSSLCVSHSPCTASAHSLAYEKDLLSKRSQESTQNTKAIEILQNIEIWYNMQSWQYCIIFFSGQKTTGCWISCHPYPESLPQGSWNFPAPHSPSAAEFGGRLILDVKTSTFDTPWQNNILIFDITISDNIVWRYFKFQWFALYLAFFSLQQPEKILSLKYFTVFMTTSFPSGRVKWNLSNETFATKTFWYIFHLKHWKFQLPAWQVILYLHRFHPMFLSPRNNGSCRQFFG